MKKTLCYQINNLTFDIKLFQTDKHSFTVEYGLQVKTQLSYDKACSALGGAIIHALSCNGKIV